MRNITKGVKCLSLAPLFGCCLGDKLWRCTSDYSKYTQQYCMRNAPTKGCYIADHHEQYLPCAGICNDVRPLSRFEEQCNAYCSGYLTGFGSCTLTEATMTTLFTGSGPPMEVSNSNEQTLPSWAWALIVVLVTISVIASAIGLVVYLRKRKKCCFQEDGQQLDIPMGELDGRGTTSGNSSAPNGVVASRNEGRTSTEVTRTAERGNEIVARNDRSPPDVNAVEGAAGNVAAAGGEPTRPSITPVQEHGIDGTCTGTNDGGDCPLTPTEAPALAPFPTQAGEDAPLLQNHGDSGEADDLENEVA